MTLFNRIQSDPALQALPEFVHLLLCRLSVSEVNAADKFKQTPSDESGQEAKVINKIRDKCIELQYSEAHTDTMTSIFKEVVTIAKLIQAAWQVQSKDRLEKDVRREAANLSRDITEGKVPIKEYAPTLTGKMLESLKKPSDIDQLELIAPLLAECFPAIDKKKLNQAMLKMIEEINLLKSFAATIPLLDSAAPESVTVEIVTSPISDNIVPGEEDYEIVGDPAEQKGPGSIGFFSSSNATNNANTSSPQKTSSVFCTIS